MSYSREYYQKNKEKQKEWNRQWRLKNPMKCSASVVKWQRLHREKYNAYLKKWQQENPEKFKALKTSYRHRHPERHRAQWIAFYTHPENKKCSIEGCDNIGQRCHKDYSKPLEIVWLCRQHRGSIGG